MKTHNEFTMMAVINSTIWAASNNPDSEGYVMGWLLFAVFFVIKDRIAARKMANSPK